MIIPIGFVVIALIVGGFIVYFSARDGIKKKPLRTVRCPPNTMTQESDARYQSVTASIGDDASKS